MNSADLYKILELSDGADEAAVDAAYSALRSEYYNGMFQDGEAGATAAENLTRLESAYKDIKNLRVHEGYKERFGSDFGVIDAKIIAGDIETAQKDLDACTVRGAEWHFLQAVIYYKRNWLSESRKHLKIAVASEPYNYKYSSALRNLDAILIAPEIIQPGMQQRGQGGQRGPSGRPDDAMGIENFCCPLCLLPICFCC
jgi:hypothetical protein